MPVGVRGFAQGQKATPGTSLAWPAGTAAGDCALVHTGGTYTGLGPQSSGWTPVGHKAFWKILTAGDVSSSLVVNASHVKVVVFTGCRGVGRTSTQNGVKVQGLNSYIWVESSRSASPIAPATYRQGAEWQDESGYWQAQYAAVSNGGWSTIPSIASGATSYTYELLPASAPSAPLLTSPDAGVTVNRAVPQSFAWQHQSPFPQTGYRLRLTTGATVRWVDSSGALQTTEQSVASASSSATVAAGALTSGAAYTWAVATQDAYGWSPYSGERAFTPIAPPTVTSVTVSAPAGDLSPEVSWAATAGYGVVEAHQVWITPAAATSPDDGSALWASSVVAGTVSPETAPSSTPWVNGASVKAWVRVWQTGGVSHTLASAAFSVSWTPPSTPTVAASVAASPPTVTVSGVASGQVVQIEQCLDGVTWSPLATRTAAGATVGPLASPLAATGAAVSFRARQASVVDGVSMWSSWSTVASVTAAAAGCWLVDDTDRSVYVTAHLREESPRQVVQGISTMYGLGASGARVDRTPEAGESGSLVWICETQAERDAIADFLSSRLVFWYVFPPDAELALRPVRMARTSPRAWDRLAQTGTTAYRLLPMSWVEQPEV